MCVEHHDNTISRRTRMHRPIWRCSRKRTARSCRSGLEIPYVMQQASPLRRKPLSPEERTIVIKAYANGAPASVLAKRYECCPDTIRAIVRGQRVPTRAFDFVVRIVRTTHYAGGPDCVYCISILARLPPDRSFLTTICLSIFSFNSATWEMIPTSRLPSVSPARVR